MPSLLLDYLCPFSCMDFFNLPSSFLCLKINFFIFFFYSSCICLCFYCLRVMVLVTGDSCWICGCGDWSSFFIHRADTAWKEAVQCPRLPKPRFGGTTTENQRLVYCLFDLVLCQDYQEDFMVNMKWCWILCSIQLLKPSAVVQKVCREWLNLTSVQTLLPHSWNTSRLSYSPAMGHWPTFFA